ncbi:MAG TPA: gamma-glutamyltransferase [Pirellulales bacterium]|nr:gamma-glutamyltransferase [Pirellulales bacterium]
MTVTGRIALGAEQPPPQAPAVQTVNAERGMVVSVSPEASDAGLAILRRGGNAVDAAVATALALAVTYPGAGNIGGGGFMLVWPGDGQEPACVDYRETAPAAATADMFAKNRAPYSHMAVGVPGTPRGLALAHKRWGKLPWRALVAPGVTLAQQGFAVDAALAEDLNNISKKPTTSAEFRRVFAPPRQGTWQAGDRLVQPELARTLQRLADDGPDAFYRGNIADSIVAEMRAGGGLITADDLARYEAKLRTPIHGTYRGFDVFGPPPPSSGGTCLVEMLNVLENFDLGQEGRFSARTAHLMIEAMRRAYCDRAQFLGDPDFVEVPSHLTTKDYAHKLAAEIDLSRATPSLQLARDRLVTIEGESTTHFSVVDADRMAVANTYTLQENFGARIVVRGAGFLLNNEMTDFNPRPGYTDRNGAIGTSANVIAPGKRMLSSQSPTIVARDGRLQLVTGSPGGRTIPNTVLCVLVNVLDFGNDVAQAVDAPRMHHQWMPDRVTMELGNEPEQAPLVRELRALGHDVWGKKREQGDAHTIRVLDHRLQGAADTRQTAGKAAGY